MGHNRTGPLPQTRKWRQIIEFIAAGAAVGQLATATATAAEEGLNAASNHAGVVETIWLLVRLPLAARTDNFAQALRECGLAVSDGPGLMELAAAFSDAIDARLSNCRGRTDLGEMAQMAAVETLTKVVGERANGLFGTTPENVQRVVSKLATVKQFGLFAKQFFSRFTFKCLNYFLSKTLPDHVGEGKRFRTVADQAKFTGALETHCREATGILLKFSGEWFSKHRWEAAGEITRDHARRFVGGAMVKLMKELRKREEPCGSK